ncbi:unnamed protein product [Linum trigynum]|uniref:Uncharacterized protein n=1 Tax=Linum trigynum TaxID=586398 RepID=A0AAV2FAS7_9ROSI
MVDPGLPDADFPVVDSDGDKDDDEKTTVMVTKMWKSMPKTVPVRFSGNLYSPSSSSSSRSYDVEGHDEEKNVDGGEGVGTFSPWQCSQECSFDGSISLSSTTQHQLSSLIR